MILFIMGIEILIKTIEICAWSTIELWGWAISITSLCTLRSWQFQ